MTANGGRPARRRAVVVLLATFVAGLVCGAAALRIGARVLGQPGFPGDRPRGADRRPLEHLALALDLDDAQRAEIRALLGEHRERMEALLDESRREIREVLRPDQQERFDRLRPEYRGRGGRPHRGERHVHPDGPPPPPEPPE
jgi:Spy/CpxP family protein refolding chaperone